MPRVNIIGVGPGSEQWLTKEAEEAVNKSSCLLGDKRVMAPFEKLGKPAVYTSSTHDITDYLLTCQEKDEVSVLVSGDVGFYSLAKSLLKHCENKENLSFNLICGISSLQYFCSKLQVPWEDAAAVSLHGRDVNVLEALVNNQKVFVLTDRKNTPFQICKTLCDHGLGKFKVSVGENLSYPDEKITTSTAETIAQMIFSSLCVMIITNNNILAKKSTPGSLEDDMFVRGNVPMTKQEVRAVTIAKLQLKQTDIVYDIGAGTGSVSIEMALLLKGGLVYAVEKNAEALELIRINKDKFGAENVRIVSAAAPEGLENLPKPDRVFIGGSSGNLQRILDTVLEKNPEVRVVINAITLETLNEAVSYLKQNPELEGEIVNLAVSRSRKIGEYHLMTAQNPVNVITLYRRKES